MISFRVYDALQYINLIWHFIKNVEVMFLFGFDFLSLLIFCFCLSSSALLAQSSELEENDDVFFFGGFSLPFILKPFIHSFTQRETVV